MQRPRKPLQPPWLGDFSRFFGPIFPEVLQRRWLLCDVIETTPYPENFKRSETATLIRELREMEIHLDIENHCRHKYVPGEYLVRIANHIDEDQPSFYGIPRSHWNEFSNSVSGLCSESDIVRMASKFCDIALDAYEGIWGAFFADPKLLARVFCHCNQIFSVREIEDGVGIEGEWLTKNRLSCPNFRFLLEG